MLRSLIYGILRFSGIRQVKPQLPRGTTIIRHLKIDGEIVRVVDRPLTDTEEKLHFDKIRKRLDAQYQNIDKTLPI
jgi:hypothetical protein